jgi:hypothetical protein
MLPFDAQHNLLPEFAPGWHSSRERELRQEMVEIVRRACERYLMIGTEGVVSARLDKHSFLITPTGLDRGNLEIEDIVLIQDGQRERDKLPSRSVRLHAAIYDMHPDVNCADPCRVNWQRQSRSGFALHLEVPGESHAQPTNPFRQTNRKRLRPGA